MRWPLRLFNWAARPLAWLAMPIATWYWERALRRSGLLQVAPDPTMPSGAGSGEPAQPEGAEPRRWPCRLEGCLRETTDRRRICASCWTDPRLEERILWAFAHHVLLETPEWPWSYPDHITGKVPQGRTPGGERVAFDGTPIKTMAGDP